VASQTHAAATHSVSAGHRGTPATACAVDQTWARPQMPKGIPNAFGVTRYVGRPMEVTVGGRQRMNLSSSALNLSFSST
jgi:hypothetical protein